MSISPGSQPLTMSVAGRNSAKHRYPDVLETINGPTEAAKPNFLRRNAETVFLPVNQLRYVETYINEQKHLFSTDEWKTESKQLPNQTDF